MSFTRTQGQIRMEVIEHLKSKGLSSGKFINIDKIINELMDYYNNFGSDYKKLKIVNSGKILKIIY